MRKRKKGVQKYRSAKMERKNAEAQKRSSIMRQHKKRSAIMRKRKLWKEKVQERYRKGAQVDTNANLVNCYLSTVLLNGKTENTSSPVISPITSSERIPPLF